MLLRRTEVQLSVRVRLGPVLRQVQRVLLLRVATTNEHTRTGGHDGRPFRVSVRRLAFSTVPR